MAAIEKLAYNGAIQLASGVIVYAASGDPEGAVPGVVGSIYLRSDGGAGTSLYVKESGSGNTGWVAQGSAAGSNIAADLPWNINNRGSSTSLSTSGFTYCQYMGANSIAALPANWTVSIYVTVALSAPIVEMCVIRTLKDSLSTVDVTPITFGGNATPTFGTGSHTSDPINLPIDADHDYYFGFSGNVFGGSGALAATDVMGSAGVTFTAFAANTNNGGNPLSVSWASSIGAGGGWGAAFPLGSGSFFLTGWRSA